MHGEAATDAHLGEKLQKVLDYVYAQQQKGETKHAGLLAFNGVIISTLLKYLPTPVCIWAVILAIAGVVFILVGVFFSIWGFYPNLGSAKRRLTKENPESGKSPKRCKRDCKLKKNDGETATAEEAPIIFFGSAAKYGCGEGYLNAFDSVCATANEYNLDLATQIVHNSKIVNHKFNTFGKALWFSIPGLCLIIASFVFNLLS